MLFRFFRFQLETEERKIPQVRILRREVVPVPSTAASALRLRDGEPVVNISRLRLIDGVPLLADALLHHAWNMTPTLRRPAL